jgi:hypothetical protein
MNLEQMPFRVLVRWLMLCVALLFAATLLGIGNMWGLIPAVVLFAHECVFHAPKAQLTDADLDALLVRG